MGRRRRYALAGPRDPEFHPGVWAAQTPDRLAVVMAGSGESLTYAELEAMANRVSQLFRAEGLGPGSHVAICLENRAEFLAVVWGATYAGVFFTPMSSRLTGEEIAYILEDSGAQALVTSPYMEAAVQASADVVSSIPIRLSVGGELAGFRGFEEAIAEHPAEPLRNRVEGRPMLYSSGTTGRPKGVKPKMPETPLGRLEHFELMMEFMFRASSDAIFLVPAPLYHAAPLRLSTQFMRMGCTIVVMEKFEAEAALEVIDLHNISHSMWVPTMLVRMLKLPPEVRARFNLSSLQYAVHTAAPCPMHTKEQMLEWWGPVLFEFYAGTEGNGLCFATPEEWLSHKGTVGRPLIGSVHIVDDEGNELPAGVEGNVYFGDGPEDFEYHNDPEKTAAGRLLNGWSTLGDIGHVDEDGFLYLTDRKANMIISGGVNVYPQEAENLLTMHPKVLDVAVFGVPNEDFGEEVKAVVEPLDGADVGPALEKELIAYCRGHLADVKCPRSVDFRGELPRSETGKLLKRLLKDEYWQGHETRIL